MHSEIECIAARLIDLARADVYLSNHHVSLSIGGAGWNPSSPGYSVESLLKDADDALYRAKEAGRDRYVMHRALS